MSVEERNERGRIQQSGGMSTANPVGVFWGEGTLVQALMASVRKAGQLWVVAICPFGLVISPYGIKWKSSANIGFEREVR